MNPINFFDLIAEALHLPVVVVATWIAMGILILFAVYARRALVEAADPTIPDSGLEGVDPRLWLPGRSLPGQ